MNAATSWCLIKTTFKAWNEDNVPRLGAALAYYSIFSMAPLVIIAIGVASLVFEEETARAGMAREIETMLGPQAAKAIEGMLENTSATGSGWMATMLGIGTLLLGASGVFLQLQDALNTIWKAPPRKGGTILNFIRERLLSLSVAMGAAFLLLVSLVISAVLTAVATFLSSAIPPVNLQIWQIVNALVSFAIITLLFAMIFKVLPDVPVAWREVWTGAVITALLFSAGKYLIGLYLGHSSPASAFGAAGSLVIILVWVYYSSQILLLGAEFTHVYAQRSRECSTEKSGAVSDDDSKRLDATEAAKPHSKVEGRRSKSGHR